MASLFVTEYPGDGTSGVLYRNLTLQSQLPINDTVFGQLDLKNGAECGILVTGDDTILDVCQNLLNSIGGYIVPGPTGLLEAGRFDFPPSIPDDTSNLIVVSPDVTWGLTNATLNGNNPAPLMETVAEDSHYASATFMKLTDKFRYLFVGEFKYAGRHLRLYFGSTQSALQVQFNLSLGEVESVFYVSTENDLFTLDQVTITDVGSGYFEIEIEFTTDNQASLQAFIVLLNSSFTDLYEGDGTSGLLFRNVSLAPFDPSVTSISEETIIGDSLQRLPTGDQGRGIPYWKITGRYGKNWRVLAGTEVIPAVDDETRARLALEWPSTAPVINNTIRSNHIGATELVFDTYLTTLHDAEVEVARRAQLYGVQRSAYRCEVPMRYAVEATLGTFVRMTATRFGLAAGRIMTVIGRVEDFENRTVTLTLWG